MDLKASNKDLFMFWMSVRKEKKKKATGIDEFL
jgi:hypothetical protein